MHPSLPTFTIALALAPCLAACAENTECTIGALACRDEVVYECVGPGAGGDEDGELARVVEDCAAAGLVCQIGARDTGTYGVCITPECRTSHRTQLCPAAGQTACSLGYVDVCAIETDGCLVWSPETDCTDTGQECVETSATMAACM